ncbi:MAG: hypothetical protein L3J74_03785 [Bacteroidales bacterium]|nr:hypothetical protein [Bacteroidales bacterium]
MIKIALKNIKLLHFINKIPLIRYFFILKIDQNFHNIRDNAVLEKFYQDIYVENKTSKKTANMRFNDVDSIALKYLNYNRKQYIHDIAVSSGITSDNFYEYLKKKNINFQMDISDKYSQISVKKGFTTKVYDADNNLSFAYWGFFFAGDKNIFFPLTVFLYKIIRKFDKNYDFNYSLYLFHPNILEKVKKQKINVVSYDIFQTTIKEKYDFVRCMNILNKTYFTDNQIMTALENIKQSIKENGILLIGRTNNKGTNNASIFQKKANKFIFMEDINKGSEVKTLV